MVTRVFCRCCGKENVLEPEKEREADFERLLHDRVDKMLCHYCGTRMATNAELLFNLSIAVFTLPSGSQKCGQCAWVSLPVASYCFKCGNPFSFVATNNEQFRSSASQNNKPSRVGDVLLGRYVVVQQNQGCFSTDYIVFDRQQQKLSRIKTVHRPALIDRFLQTAQLWLNIPFHKNVIAAYSLEELDHRSHLFLEYVNGQDLRRLMTGETKLDIPKILEITIQICEGMEHLGTMGLAHRDLKPENIIVGDDGIVRIGDLKIIRVVTDQNVSDNSRGEICGTPPYMSPEQWEGSASTDNRSDIYSFGVLLFEMVCGSRPFAGAKFADFYKGHKGEIPVEPITLRSECPRALNDLIVKCLQKKPEDRYQSFGAIKMDLVKIKETACLTSL